MLKKIKDFELGSVIVDPGSKYNKLPIEWILVNKNNSKNEITLMTKDPICIKELDAEEKKSNDEIFKTHGNSDYELSNIKKWLNSSFFNWYNNGLHELDAFPSYFNEVGFLYNISDGFYTKMKSKTNAQFDKIFLPTFDNIFGNNENKDSNQFEFFKLEKNNIKTKAIDDSDSVATSTSNNKGFSKCYNALTLEPIEKKYCEKVLIRPAIILLDDFYINNDSGINIIDFKYVGDKTDEDLNLELKYDKTEWKDKETNLEAANFNKIENQLETLTKYMNTKALRNHAHNEYSLVNHTHENISNASHNHDMRYSKLNHKHENILSSNKKNMVLPNETGNGMYSFFIENSSNNIKNDGNNSVVFHCNPNKVANDFSESFVYELGFSDNGKVFIRLGKNKEWLTYKEFCSTDSIYNKEESDNRFYLKSEKIMTDKIYHIDENGTEYLLKDILNIVLEKFNNKAICGTFKAGEMKAGQI